MTNFNRGGRGLCSSLKPREASPFSLMKKETKNQGVECSPKFGLRVLKSKNSPDGSESNSFDFLTSSPSKFLTAVHPKAVLTKRFKPSALLMIFCVLFSSLVFTQAVAQGSRGELGTKGLTQTVLRGVVSSLQDGRPIEGASVTVEKKHARTDKEGRFTISVDKPTGVLTIKHIGYKEQRVAYENTATILNIALQPGEKQIEEVEVVSTGYQKLPKERATGSFEFIDSALFNRKVSTDIISRLEDVVPGISSTKVYGDTRGKIININIRGLSTLESNAWPLLVVDGVAYENRFANNGLGMFNNINPNDVESITVLKDAAALSIWGAQSANGVVVITTKRGKFNERSKLSFNSNLTIARKPDLYQLPQINTSDYIDLIQFMFSKNRYPNSRFTDWRRNPEPILWLMYKQRKGDITADELNKELDSRRDIDIRDDLSKYVYRKAVNQQYNVSLQSGTNTINNILSIGYDMNNGQIVNSLYNRLNLKAVSQIKPIDRLMLDVGINYTQSRAKEDFESPAYNRIAKGASNYPYMKFADEYGNPMKVEINSPNPGFLDTVAGGRLLNLDYYPFKQIGQTSLTQDIRETMINFAGTYSFDFGLKLNGLLAYQRTNSPIEIWKSNEVYSERYYANLMASWDKNTVKWNYPIGDYLQIENWDSQSLQSRLSVDYNHIMRDDHEISALAGMEVREVNNGMTWTKYLGMDPETRVSQEVAYGVDFAQWDGKGIVSQITNDNRYQMLVNRYVSFFGNGAYTYRNRYILSGSFRKDASNLFGVKSNDRGQPFWSTGLAWILSREPWLKTEIINLLKIRATYGYNGNINPSITAYPIMSVQDLVHSITGEKYALIGSPPNPKLRWERTGVLNLGVDFSLWQNRFEGSIEYYRKKPKDLISYAPVDPSIGYSALKVNSANLDTKGWDIRLSAKVLRYNNWGWNSDLNLSYTRTTVTEAFLQSDISSYYTGGSYAKQVTPIAGMDLQSQLVYKWAGLDPETGAPRAYLNGEVSTNYVGLMSASVANLENMGSLVPLYYGSFRNALRYKALELSCNISFQLGHVFQRSSFSNSHFYEFDQGHKDYALRWQKPGDELITDVPAFIYPVNLSASTIYEYSSALTENAGQIKLRDVQMSVRVSDISSIRLKNLRLYAYVNNIGVIWRANKLGIDPEFGDQYSDPLSTSVGVSFNF